ncbi:MAG TPA: cytochrome P450 [Streptosporangiaceae bacterium]|jgi:cytochrome P450|nr:cytochrome P450 [Streptosporangiaceae bacterium]
MTAAEAVTLAGLADDPHPALARLREHAPVAWVPVLGGWLVTGYAEAVAVMRDSRAFTVDDPRFSTARVVGPSMLSLDGAAHARHRAPFASAFHHGGGARLAVFAEAEAGRLVTAIRDRGAAEIRRDVAGPLAVSVVSEALGLTDVAPETILSWYSRIVGAVTELSAGQDAISDAQPGPDAADAFASLAASLRATIEARVPGSEPSVQDGSRAPGMSSVLAEVAGAGQLASSEVISDAAVIMFGGIDTTDGMIANAVLHLLSAPDQLAVVHVDPGLLPAAIEESLRLEPAAALVDRYATRDADIAGATIRAGDRVTVSLAAANRDPAVFRDPDRFDIFRADAGRHLAFAHGPHFCIGAGLARAEAQAAVQALLGQLPGLRLDPGQPAPAPRGLVFRKPPALHVAWDI